VSASDEAGRGAREALRDFGTALGAAPLWLRWLRRRVRASEFWLLIVAVAVGAAAGLTTRALGALSNLVHERLFSLPPNVRLSAIDVSPGTALLWLPVGGLLLGLLTWLWRRGRPGPIVDPVEANALRGGRMSLRESAFLSLQTLISNGCGASVGLEAAYAQLGGAFASATGGGLQLRRNDRRILVGAGAGAAIGAAFGAPLTGAFYAFELIIGSYTVVSVAPVVAAALAGYLVVRALGGVPHIVDPTAVDLGPPDYVACVGLGVLAAVVAIAVMRAVALTEEQLKRFRIPRPVRPMIGGGLVALLALWTPQILASGHGALERRLVEPLEPAMLFATFGLKAAASILSLGFGFRGGLFFASLFLGALLGQIWWLALVSVGAPAPDLLVCALVGMATLAAGIVGGPLTVSFLVLETTGDFALTGATLAGALVCGTIVRELFGYSFSTWRFHLRGETIRSAHDVGRLRSLTAGGMMRKNIPCIDQDATVAEFRRRFPLGSANRVILLDSAQRYSGLVVAADVWAGEPDPVTPVSTWARHANLALAPAMNVADAMAVFERSGTEELAVVDADRAVLGLLTERFAARRYAEELEKIRQDLTGES
jgi:CIC family chloride channel protein